MCVIFFVAVFGYSTIAKLIRILPIRISINFSLYAFSNFQLRKREEGQNCLFS